MKNLLYFLRNKYFIAFVVFVVWLSFFDRHSVLDRSIHMAKINKLKQEKDYYLKKIKSDREKIHQLETNTITLEKFAREQYLMKRENEDIFLVMPEEKKAD
ncbi:MAG: septum formation initiator family protein [Marinifilaceae bacterium]|nr:septum formation initiator family protein [Marinifilaceae bacterium]